MADFNFYFNRVGVRGPKGEQGEQGFSPIITVATDTLSEYILQIQTQNNTFLTANLREHKDDLGGTYIRYNRETGVMYAGEADTATTQNLGEVRFATATELERNDGSTVVTPANVNTLIDARNYDGAIEAVDDKADANADNITINANNIATNAGNISTLQGQMSGVLSNYVTTNTSQTISGMKTFSNGIRCLTLRDSSGTPYISFNPSAQNKYLLISDNTTFEQNVSVVGNLTTSRNNESNIVIDSGNLGNYVDGTTITYSNGQLSAVNSGSSYTEGPGINIDNDEISVDDTVVALKSDLPNMNNYYNTTQVDLMLNEKADVSDISNMATTDTAQTFTGDKTFRGILLTTDSYSFLGVYNPQITSYVPLLNTDGNYGLNINPGGIGPVDVYGTAFNVHRSGQTYTNVDSGNINSYALTNSNISTNTYIQALEARIAALEANINGGNA